MLETEHEGHNDVKIGAEKPTESNTIEEIDQSGIQSPNAENVPKEEPEEAPSAIPGLCHMPQSKSGGGWGSWAASLLTTALQLDEEDDSPYTPVEKKDDPGSVIDSQPEFVLPSQNSAIERGATEEENNVPDEASSGAGSYVNVSGLGTWGSGWVSGAFTSAKQQSANAAQFLKKDLTEFATVVKKDTAGIASATSKSLQTKLNVSDESVGKLKGDVSYFLGSVKSTLYQTTTQFYSHPEHDNPNRQQYEASASARIGQGACAENTLENKLGNIYKDQDTYLKDPSDSPGYEKYRSEFDVEAIKADISNLLISHSEVRIFYSKLVPSQVSHADFWARLWFRKHAVEADFERKNEILSKVQTSLEGDLLDWGDDDDDDDDDCETQPNSSDAKGAPSHQPEPEEASESAKRDKVMPAEESGSCEQSKATLIDNDVFEPIDTDTAEQSRCNSGETQHIEDPSSLNTTLHTPPESTTSDEWEKDFDEARNH